MTDGSERYGEYVGDAVPCLDCGSLVLDTTVHDRFHAILNQHAKAIAVLVNSHIGPLTHDLYNVGERIGKNDNNWSTEAFAEVTGLSPKAASDGGQS